MYACDVAGPSDESEAGKDGSWKCVNISVGVGAYPGTRSVLTGNDIEGRVTCVTLAAYDEKDVLADVKHYESGISSMTLDLLDGPAYTVYALVNMGDMSSAFPLYEDDVENIEYVVPSYDDVNEKGLPMCGVGKEMRAADEKHVIGLERLFAKLSVRILHSGLEDYSEDSDWVENMCNKSLFIRQANSRLMPFADGGSAAGMVSDIMALADRHENLDDRDAYQGHLDMTELCPGPGYFQDTTVVFYVPENIQDDILLDNEDPFGKTPENMPIIGDKSYADICTYLEFNAYKPDSQGYSGTLQYRYYLGSDNTSDFTVERNREYEMILNFSEKGFFMDNWKISRGEDWKDTRSLYFLEDSYSVTKIRPVNVKLHYHPRNATGGSMPDPSKWVYSYDEEAMSQAGLILTFYPDSLIDGDFFFRAETIEYPKVGASIPIKAMTPDGVVCDSTVITIGRPMYMYIQWESEPRYLSQYGVFKLIDYDEDDFPVTITLANEEKITCDQLSRERFKITIHQTGAVLITATNALGTKKQTTFVDGLVPHFSLDTNRVELSLDGKISSIGFQLLNKSDYPIYNIDEKVFDKILAPITTKGPEYLGVQGYLDRIDLWITDPTGLKAGDTFTFNVSQKTYSWYNPITVTAVITDPSDSEEP